MSVSGAIRLKLLFERVTKNGCSALQNQKPAAPSEHSWASLLHFSDILTAHLMLVNTAPSAESCGVM
jgi:hypothetical protein